jgi:phenylacetate-coenzyme A ligase PaaK-like adenylate-forming protein
MTLAFDPVQTSATALDVLAAGRGSTDAIISRQRNRLVQLLKTAIRDSPFYRERLHGLTAEAVRLDSLPVFSRHELMQRFDDWVTDPELKFANLQAFAADPSRIAEAYLGKYLVWESSGSSGRPGLFIQDAKAMATYDALEVVRRSPPRQLKRYLDPFYLTERMAFVGATDGHYASFVSAQRLRQINPWMAHSMRCFSILQATGALVEELNTFAPTTIATYPTVAALLADQAACGGLHFSPSEVWTGGETLSPAVRQRVEKVLDTSVRNSYGASEFMSIAWECAMGQLHVNADWVILEPVDEHYRPVPAGQQSNTCLLTNLANTVQPLIRYDLGDQITVIPERCACGSPLPVIMVAGRHDAALTMQARDGRAVILLPLALTTLLEEQAGVFDFQLRQHDGHTLELRLALPGAEGLSALARCRTLLQEFVRQQGVDPFHIIETQTAALTRTSSGKVQRVVTCSD